MEKTQKGMDSLKSGVITGSSKEEITLVGVKDEGTSEFTGTFILNPMVYHTVIESNFMLDGPSKEEIYVTADDFYANSSSSSSEFDGWVNMGNILLDGDALNMIDSVRLNVIIDNIDKFDYTEDSDHYIITYTGPDEEYKDLVHLSLLKTGDVGA